MGDLLHIHDAHGHVQRLIPWFVNGTLHEDEEALVRKHCDECAVCRADVAGERQLRAAVSSTPVEADLGWRALREKLLQSPPPRRCVPRFSLGGPVPLAWALVSQAAVAAVVAIVFVSLSPADQSEEYHLLGTPQSTGGGNVIALFSPDAAESAMREALLEVDGRIVDGPTASGAYVLEVAADGRAAAIDRLRAMRAVVLAEPISIDTAP